MTLVELCVVILVMGIIMVMGTAALLRARLAGHESNAIAALRTINKAQIAYVTDCGNGHYATALTVLGRPRRAGGQGYVAEDLGSADSITRRGYTVVLTRSTLAEDVGSDCHGTPTANGYYASAVPEEYGTSGNRSFATSNLGAVWEINGAAAPTEPFAPPARLLAP